MKQPFKMSKKKLKQLNLSAAVAQNALDLFIASQIALEKVLIETMDGSFIGYLRGQ